MPPKNNGWKTAGAPNTKPQAKSSQSPQQNTTKGVDSKNEPKAAPEAARTDEPPCVGARKAATQPTSPGQPKSSNTRRGENKPREREQDTTLDQAAPTVATNSNTTIAVTTRNDAFFKALSGRMSSLQQQFPTSKPSSAAAANQKSSSDASTKSKRPPQSASVAYSPLPPLSIADAVLVGRIARSASVRPEATPQVARKGSNSAAKKQTPSSFPPLHLLASEELNIHIAPNTAVAPKTAGAVALFAAPSAWPSPADAAASACAAHALLSEAKLIAANGEASGAPNTTGSEEARPFDTAQVASDISEILRMEDPRQNRAEENEGQPIADFSAHCADPARGLLNASNACFLNATLQGLVHVPAIASYLVAIAGRPSFSSAVAAAASVTTSMPTDASTPPAGSSEGVRTVILTIPPPPSGSLGPLLGLWTAHYYSRANGPAATAPKAKGVPASSAPSIPSHVLNASCPISQPMRAPSLQGLLKAEVRVQSKTSSSSTDNNFYKPAASFDLTGSTQEDASEFLQLLCETLKIEERIEREREMRERGEGVVEGRPSGASSAFPPSATSSQALLHNIFQSTLARRNEGGGGGGGAGKWVTVGARKGEERLSLANGSGDGGGINSELTAPSFVGPQNAAAAAGAMPPSAAANPNTWSFLTAFVLNGNLQSHVRRMGKGGGTSSHANGGSGGVSITTQPFFFLPVSLHHKPSQTIEEALKNSFEAEVVEVSGAGAANTGGYELHKKEYIGTLPNVLLLQLKRWATTREGDIMKIDNIVTFGDQLAVPAEICSEGAKKGGVPLAERAYTLRAVVCHRGNDPIRGHYVTYLNNCSPDVISHFTSASSAPPQQQQLSRQQRFPLTLCDDSRLSIKNINAAVNDTPYFLFYSRNY